MKKKIFSLLLLLAICLSSCSMESAIPESERSFSKYLENAALFQAAVDDLKTYEDDILISRTDFYKPQGSENFVDLYLQNMSDSSFTEFQNANVQKLFDVCGVKLIDLVHKNGIVLVVFDMCVPGRNFDYGFYFVSEDKPVYFGDVTHPLSENGKGFSYEQKASYGTKFVYYTERIADHFYYYEIS